MRIKLLTTFLIISLFGCKDAPKERTPPTSTQRAPSQDYSTILEKREQASTEKDLDSLGKLVKSIEFHVLTKDKKSFENGVIPWASIEKPESDIPYLIDANTIVLPEHKVTLIIDYPLTNEVRFELESTTGFSRAQLLKEISAQYYKLYQEEESTATIKTIPVDKRTTLYNRNETNGKYGIWGHDIADLVLTDISVYKTSSGQLLLTLNIDS